MRKTILIIALTAGLLSGVVRAQDIEPFSASHMPTNSDYWAELVAARFERQARMDELMGTISEEMAEIRRNEDRAQRAALMATHREHMREAMALMRGMGGERMREVISQHMGPTAAAGVNSEESGDTHKDATSAHPRTEMSDAQRLGDIENRLDMMQVMMESFLEHCQEISNGTG